MNDIETSEIWNKLTLFVREQSGLGNEPLFLQTRLERDLGITGGDGVDFMDAFFEKFKIEVLNFDYSKYFGDEGFSLFGLFSKKRKDKLDLTLNDLYQTLNRGEFIPPND